jgi:glutathione peroxidase
LSAATSSCARGVNGDGATPLYRQLTQVTDADDEAGPVQWNFEKFLLTADGRVLGRFRPRTEPASDTVRAAIEAALPG